MGRIRPTLLLERNDFKKSGTERVNMAFTATFAGRCSFHEIFHYISHIWGSISSITARISSLSSWIAVSRNHSARILFTLKTDGFAICVAYSAVLFGINIVYIHIFQFWPQKFINHGSIAQPIHRNSHSRFIFKKNKAQWSLLPKNHTK